MISSEVRHQLAGKLWSRHFGDFSVCELEAMAPLFFAWELSMATGTIGI